MKRVVDFPDRDSIDAVAVEWLIRFDGDEPLSKDEIRRFTEWAHTSRLHSKRIQQLAAEWDKLNVLTELTVPLAQPRRRWLAGPSWSRLGRAAVTAAVLAGVIAGVLYWYVPDPITDTNGFYATAIGDQASATLVDGSVVLLNTNTQIRVAYDQNFRNIHLLQGEAHFSVAENDEKPFRVFAGLGRIDAVGTAFAVYLRGDLVDVTVTEGRVNLASTYGPLDTVSGFAAQNTPVSRLGELVAGQAATITRMDEEANSGGILNDLRVVEAREMSKLLSWREGVLIFSGEPLEDVVEQISRYTSVEIEFSDPDVRSIRIGGRFPVGETDIMLNALEEDFGLRVIRASNNQIIVSDGN